MHWLLWERLTLGLTLLPRGRAGGFLILHFHVQRSSHSATLSSQPCPLNRVTISHTVTGLYVVPALFGVLRAQTKVRTSSFAPANSPSTRSFSPSVFSISVFPAEPTVAIRSLSRPSQTLPEQRSGLLLFYLLLASVVNYHVEPGLELCLY